MKYLKRFESADGVKKEYWIVKSTNDYITMFLMAFDSYENYKNKFINNTTIQSRDKLIIILYYSGNNLILLFDEVTSSSLKYYNNSGYVYKGSIMNEDDVDKFLNEVEFDRNVNKYNL